MIKGSVEALDLVKLLQLLHDGGLTGRLRLALGGRRCQFLLHEGNLVACDASLAPIDPKVFEESLYDLLFTTQGFYAFRPKRKLKIDDSLPRLNTRSVLVEASTRKDEWERAATLFPSFKALILPRDRKAEAILNERFAELGIATPVRFGATSIEDLIAAAQSPYNLIKSLTMSHEEGLLRVLSAAEIETQLESRLGGQPRRTAFRLYEWMLEVPELADVSERFDHVLLRKRWMSLGGFTCRTPGPRALHILSRMLRYKETFEFTASHNDVTINVHAEDRLITLRVAGDTGLPDMMTRVESSGLLTARQLQDAHNLAESFGCSPVDLLVDRRFLTPEQWIKLCLEELLEVCFLIFTWPRPLLRVRATPDQRELLEQHESLHRLVIPLSPANRQELRLGLMKWKLFRQIVPSVEAIFIATEMPAPGEPRKATHYLDGRRRVLDLMAMARATPQELLQFIYRQARAKLLRPLSLDEHRAGMLSALHGGRRTDLVPFYRSAIVFGHRSLGDDPALTDAVRLAREEAGTNARVISTFQGRLGRLSLAELIQTLLHSGLEGTLRVGIDTSERVLHFVDGGLWVILTAEQQGDALAPNDFLTESTEDLLGMLQAAFENQSEERVEELRAMIQEEVLEALFWDGAWFEFARNFIPSEFYDGGNGTQKVRLAEDRLLFESMRRMAEWDELRHVLRSTRAVFEFVDTESKLAAYQQFGDFVTFIDGRRSLREVLELASMPRLELYRSLCAMVDQGQIKMVKMMAPRILDRSGTEVRQRWDLSV